jgi:V/A-type H+-transporting ATPase subunit A
VDGVTNPERLRIMFDLIKYIIDAPLHIETKDDIRSHFNFLRQAFLDWNYLKLDDPKFEKQKTKIINLVKQKANVKENV